MEAQDKFCFQVSCLAMTTIVYTAKRDEGGGKLSKKILQHSLAKARSRKEVMM